MKEHQKGFAIFGMGGGLILASSSKRMAWMQFNILETKKVEVNKKLDKAILRFEKMGFSAHSVHIVMGRVAK